MSTKDLAPDHEKAREWAHDWLQGYHPDETGPAGPVQFRSELTALVRAYLAQAAELEEVKRVLVEWFKANNALLVDGPQWGQSERCNKAQDALVALARRLAEEGAKK